MVQSAARGLQSSPVTTVVAVLTIGIALLLVGGFALVVGNMQGMLDRFAEELHISAFLDPGLDAEVESQLAQRAATLSGVQDVELVSKSEALERFRRSAGGADLLEGLEENPLPSSLEIVVAPDFRTPERLPEVSAAITALNGVEELSHGQEWVEGYARVAALVRVAAYGLGAVLTLSALLIVSNTIRLAVYARADELEILDLVGASPVYIRTPFLLEGVLQGIVGGLLALAALWVVYQLALPRVEFGLEVMLGNAAPRFFTLREAGWLVTGGAGLGVLGSASALLGWRS
jgi:cell division transport system permease protein